MKRIMALFAAMLMLLSIVSVAFAQETNETVITETEIIETEAPAEAPVDEIITETPTDAPLCTDAAFTCGMCYQVSEGQYLPVSVECPLEEETETPEPVVVEVTEDTQVTVTEVPAEETGVVTAEEVDEAGITPDQPVLWGLERAIERVSLALTLGKSAKAQKGLAHARERLMEVKTMIAEKKFDKAENAREEHGKALGRVKQAVEEINGDKEPEEVLKEQTEFENELEDQEKELEQTREKARTKLRLTAEQQAKIAALVSEFNGDVSDAKVKVELKKNKIKIAIQAKTGKTSEEVKEMDNEIKEQVRAEVKKGEDTSSPDREQGQIQATSIKRVQQADAQEPVIKEEREDEAGDDDEGDDDNVNVGGAVSITANTEEESD